MNITFLIGNGFDINLGLNTKYSDFIKYYKIIKDTDSDKVKKFKDDISENEQYWSYAELEFGRYTGEFDGEKRTLEDFFECHINFCDELAAYLEKEENTIELKEGFVKSIAGKVLDIGMGMREIPKLIINNFINSYDGGLKYNFLSFNYTRIVDKICDELGVGGYLGTRRTRTGTYTNSLGKVVHVHGYTDKDMILGVNDTSQISNLELFENGDELYLQSIIKQSTNELCEEGTDEIVHEIIKASDLLYIYGMSIGETDAIWWERICEVLSKNKNKRIIIYAHGAPPDSRNRLQYKFFEKKQLEHFISFYKGTEEQKRAISGQITIVKENIFKELINFVEIKQIYGGDDEVSNHTVITEENFEKHLDEYMEKHTVAKEDIDDLFQKEDK